MLQVEEIQDFEKLLSDIKQNHAVDLTAYKPVGLMRRIQRRMQEVQIHSYDEYRAFLKTCPDEVSSLLNVIEVNVTHFFRDPSVWSYIATKIIPQLLAAKPSGEPIRVWSAGCASGEEACTIAMLLAEALGLDQFQQQVKIYGTDIDQEAVLQARQGSYSQNKVRSLPASFLTKYFTQLGDRYVFHKDLRSRLVFAKRDLMQHAPFFNVDVLLCRNTLMYFDADAQSRILTRFHFGLRDTGFLILGKPELPNLATSTSYFTPIDLEHRIYTKLPGNIQEHNLYSKAFQQWPRL